MEFILQPPPSAPGQKPGPCLQSLPEQTMQTPAGGQHGPQGHPVDSLLAGQPTAGGTPTSCRAFAPLLPRGGHYCCDPIAPSQHVAGLPLCPTLVGVRGMGPVPANDLGSSTSLLAGTFHNQVKTPGLSLSLWHSDRRACDRGCPISQVPEWPQ